MDVIRKLWWGLYPLRQSFWGFYVFGGLGIMILTTILGALLLIKLPQLRPIVYTVGLCIVWAYWALATVGVWRSASLYTGIKFWPIAAKFLIVVVVGNFIFRLVDGGAQTLIGRTMGSWNWSQ